MGKSGKPLAAATNSAGYKIVNMVLADKSRTTVLCHRTVAAAFVTKTEPGFDMVNHIDGNRSNNAASNLEWTCHGLNHMNTIVGSKPSGLPRGVRKSKRGDRFESQWTEVSPTSGKRRARCKTFGTLEGAVDWIKESDSKKRAAIISSHRAREDSKREAGERMAMAMAELESHWLSRTTN